MLWAQTGTEGMFGDPANYCFPMFMAPLRFHNSPEHGGFECTFLIYQALYQVIRPFTRQTPAFPQITTDEMKMYIISGASPSPKHHFATPWKICIPIFSHCFLHLSEWIITVHLIRVTLCQPYPPPPPRLPQRTEVPQLTLYAIKLLFQKSIEYNR